jgi:hypothetical protein
LLLQGHNRTSGTAAYGLLEKLMTVKLFPLQSYKQVTSIKGATVSGDFAETLLSTLHQKLSSGGFQYCLQSPSILLFSHVSLYAPRVRVAQLCCHLWSLGHYAALSLGRYNK